MSDGREPSVIARRQGRIGRITLDRPKALNALDLGMVRAVAAALEGWRDDPAVHAVVIDGTGGRAFCAGGDVRELRRLSIAGDYAGVETFFREEYALNLAIARYPKPYIALIDGLCMGGGIGLSVHGTARVVSEAATFAMPETAIGMIPDIGATFVLPRLRGCWGMAMALTGLRLGGADATWVGLATHFVPQAEMAGLVDALAADGVAALALAAKPPPPSPLAHEDASVFGAGSVAAIIEGLGRQGTRWASDAVATIRSMSPTAVLWSYAMVRQGESRTLEQCLAAELALTSHVARHPDFREGVRAMVVDKDRAPHWSPSRLEDVDPDAVTAATPA